MKRQTLLQLTSSIHEIRGPFFEHLKTQSLQCVRFQNLNNLVKFHSIADIFAEVQENLSVPYPCIGLHTQYVRNIHGYDMSLTESHGHKGAHAYVDS